MKGLKLFGIALSIAAVSAAFASGWTVSVSTSKGTLFGPAPSTQTNVPFIINTFGSAQLASNCVVNTLPQVTFLTALGNPNPILVGDGTSFTGGTYTAAYTITSTKAPLIGFNFVVQGFVFDLGQIIWTKKVVDINTSQILYNGSGVFSGASYRAAATGMSASAPLSRSRARRRMCRSSRPSSCMWTALQCPDLDTHRCCWWSRTGCLSLRACSR
jgi:hypothetical protein